MDILEETVKTRPVVTTRQTPSNTDVTVKRGQSHAVYRGLDTLTHTYLVNTLAGFGH